MATSKRPYIVDCVTASTGREIEVRVMARSRDEAMTLASGDGVLASNAYLADDAPATPAAPPVAHADFGPHTDPLHNPATRGDMLQTQVNLATLKELRAINEANERAERKKSFSIGRVFALTIIILLGGPLLFFFLGPLGLIVLLVLIIVAAVTL